MSGIDDLLSKAGTSGEQLFIWQVLGAVAGAIMTPAIQSMTTTQLKLDANTPLDANTAAVLAAQAIISDAQASTESHLTGVDDNRISWLIDSAKNSLDMGAVIAAFQRGLIGVGSFDPTDISLSGAAASASIREQWLPVLEKLAVSIPTVAEVMNAWLEGQIGEDEANTRYLAAGGDPTWFQTAYNANGQAPTPMELLEMVNRGIIPVGGTGPSVTSYDQGFLEGPWRNKWQSAILGLRDYYPPPRTVTAMYHDGQLTQAQASSYLAKQGLTPELIAAYLSPTKTTTAETGKTLTKSDILGLYTDGIIDGTKAQSLLVALKYPADQAALLIKLADAKTAHTALTTATTQLRELYQAGKITRADVLSELGALGMPKQAIDTYLEIWTKSAATTVKTLTAAQIADAWEYELFTTDEALNRLQALGYDDLDAYIVLAVKVKGPVPNVSMPAGAHTPAPPPTTGA